MAKLEVTKMPADVKQAIDALPSDRLRRELTHFTTLARQTRYDADVADMAAQVTELTRAYMDELLFKRSADSNVLPFTPPKDES